MNSLRGLPPVELYKVGEGYFVVDGNHRISVARANGNRDVEAVVTEWQTHVPYTLEDFADNGWLHKAAYADFLAETELDQVRPGAMLQTSNVEDYATLLQHIAVHRYLVNRAAKEPHQPIHKLGWKEAVGSWYDTVYLPVISAVRAQGVHARFPTRTESDLYLAITQHREQVAEAFGLAPLDVVTAVAVYAANHHERWRDRLVATLRLPALRAQVPEGMSPAEFALLRLRHAAGELGLIEGERKAAQEPQSSLSLCECDLNMQFSM
jgi:hypothetical protein